MTTTHIANPQDTAASITAELDMIECWLDCAHDHQRYTSRGYALALEGVTRALIQHVRLQQPVVDAAVAFEQSRKGVATGFDSPFWRLIRAVRTHKEQSS